MSHKNKMSMVQMAIKLPVYKNSWQKDCTNYWWITMLMYNKIWLDNRENTKGTIAIKRIAVLAKKDMGFQNHIFTIKY